MDRTDLPEAKTQEAAAFVSGSHQVAACKVCGNESGNRTHQAREMMFGWGGCFTYVECGACGCLALEEIPEDLARYYPDDYLSFVGIEHGFRGLALKLRARSYFGRGLILGSWLARRYPRPDLAAMVRAKVPRDYRILDVGCGVGRLLLEMRDAGYTNLTGIDPFISKHIDYGNGVRIRKCSLTQLQETGWDLIMFHHSLEHIPDQFQTLKAAAHLLAPGGTCMIRIPVIGWAWEHYGTNWVGLDAPRHLFLHTEKSFRLLAESAGLIVTSIEHDTFEFNFWASELYRRGVALKPAGVPRRFFGAKQIREFRRKSAELNAARRGDQAVFILASC